MTEPSDIAALAKGGRTNIIGFALRLVARLPFLFIAGRVYGPEIVGRFALAILVVELAALLATLGLRRGLAQALATTERPHVDVVWDAMAVAFVASIIGSAVLFVFPQIMYPNSEVIGFERLLPCIVFAIAWADVSLAALAYRHNVRASVTARAVVEPWTISIAAFAFSYLSARDGLILAYVTSNLAALAASLTPFVRSYGVPQNWKPRFSEISALARRNIPLAGADAIEWASRNVDRFILGLLFGPAVVGVYYMAQQVASLPQKLKTSFDPVLGPVITQSLASGDHAAIARQVRQVGFWIMAAQTGLALMGSIPAEAVMGVVGPEFVAGAGAMVFLLVAEVLAANGAVSESALVYMARHRNLMISLVMLGFQIALSFALVFAMRGAGWPETWQAAGPAVALALSVGLTSIIKSRLLARLLRHPVSAWRWSLFLVAAMTGAVGMAFASLPERYEWATLAIGEPVIFVLYLTLLWYWACGPDDRSLLRRKRGEEPSLPPETR